MCEIAVVDPEISGIAAIHQIAGKFHEEQGDGIGVLLVENNGDHFDYKAYKSVHPHWQTLYSFLNRNLSKAWRVVIHGRYSTSGGVNREAAHPIPVDCPECEFEYVVHNGSVTSHKNKRSGLISQGHEFVTEVDTETIPHTIGELPDDLEDFEGTHHYNIRGSLNYLVFSENGLFVRTSNKYHLGEDFTMTCSYLSLNGDDLGISKGRSNKWLLARPDEDEPEIEVKETTYNTSANTSGGRKYGPYGTSGGSDWDERDIAWSEEEDGMYPVRYNNHSNWDGIIAMKVAPGVMRVLHEESGKDHFFFRMRDPEMYYWYAPDERPDDVGLPSDIIDERSNQQSIDDFSEADADEVAEVAYEAVKETLTNELEKRDVGEASEVEDEIAEALGNTRDAIKGAIEG